MDKQLGDRGFDLKRIRHYILSVPSCKIWKVENDGRMASISGEQSDALSYDGVGEQCGHNCEAYVSGQSYT